MSTLKHALHVDDFYARPPTDLCKLDISLTGIGDQMKRFRGKAERQVHYSFYSFNTYLVQCNLALAGLILSKIFLSQQEAF